MTRRLLLDSQDGLLLAAVQDGDSLIDFYVDQVNKPDPTGAVVAARLERAMPAVRAAFVRYGHETGWATPWPTKQQPAWLQIKQPPRGTKATVLSPDVMLTGAALHYVPAGQGVSLSQRLPKNLLVKYQQALDGAFASGGVVVRHTAAQANAKFLQAEAAALAAQWQTLPADGSPAHALVDRALQAHFFGLQQIVCAPSLRGWLIDILQQRWGWLADSLTGMIDWQNPEFDWGILLAQLTSPKLPLPGGLGGEIWLESTAACHTIDVDADARSDWLTLNRHAATLAARQLRWRNWGGMVLIDFVSMSPQSTRAQLTASLEKYLATDKHQIDMRGWGPLGMYELIRPRRYRSVAEVIGG